MKRKGQHTIVIWRETKKGWENHPFLRLSCHFLTLPTYRNPLYDHLHCLESVIQSSNTSACYVWPTYPTDTQWIKSRDQVWWLRPVHFLTLSNVIVGGFCQEVLQCEGAWLGKHQSSIRWGCESMGHSKVSNILRVPISSKVPWEGRMDYVGWISKDLM